VTWLHLSIGGMVRVLVVFSQKWDYYVTLPYFKGNSNSAKTTVSYDTYRRGTAERAPGECMKYTYSGKTVTILDSIKNMSITREIDNSASLTKSTDSGGDITYSYFASKLVKQITSVNLSATMEYDAFGRQSKLIDPNAGKTKYGYNPYGQLITQTDALNRITRLAYDTLRRMKTRNELTFNTTWSFNTNTTLTRMKGSHGVTQKYTYDGYTRIKSVTDSINSLQLTTSYDYNSDGRISKITYPSDFSITYTYQNGYLKEIKRGDNSVSIWKLDTLDARGQITDETFGNGVKGERTYDANGYLTLIKTGTNGNIQNLEYIYNTKGQMYQLHPPPSPCGREA
jgi:YD repeat-containing protein